MDLTWLGYVYIIASIIMMMVLASQVGRTVRRTITWYSVIGHGIAMTLWFWGYAVVGVVH